MTKDYYKILGVSELCTNDELKSAYRKLARKWHPDVAGNTEDVVNRFKEINEAYEVLSDKLKKSEYDTVRRYYSYSSSTNPQTRRTEFKTKNNTQNNTNKTNTKTENKKEQNNFNFNFVWEEFISKYKEYANKYEGSVNNKTKNDRTAANDNSKSKAPRKGSDINTDVEITISEAVSGTVKVINMLHSVVCPICGGRKFSNGGICPHCKGKGNITEHKRFTVKIPAGIKDNSKIRLSGEGEKGLNGGRNGDLYITVHIKSPVDYQTDGNNILKTVTLAPYDAVLGGNITVKTFDGNITVKIAPNTQNGQKIRLSGCGIRNGSKTGDMILTVEIRIPRNLSNLEIELYKRLKEASSANIN